MKLLLRCTTLATLSLLHTAVGNYSDNDGLRGVEDDLESDNDLDRNLVRNCGGLPSFEDESQTPETAISFFAFGVIPTTYDERLCLNGQLRHIDLKYDNDAKLVFHLGDAMSSSNCDADSYTKIANMFTHYRNSRAFDSKDVFFVPGDKEWNSCDKREDAWKNWVNILGPNSKHEFGQVSSEDVTVARQTGVYRPGKVERNENFAFLMDKTLFIGVNVVGGGKTGDEEVRLTQNFEWIAENMRLHKIDMVAAVIFGHSALNSSNSKRIYMGNPIKDLLRKEFRKFPVLYVSASGSTDPGFCAELAGSKTPNYYAVQLDKGANAPPVKISLLHVGDEYKFHVDQRGGPYGKAGCPKEGKNTWKTDFEDTPERPQLFTPELFTYGRSKKTVPLGLCQGSCLNNKECEGDLVCFKRTGDEAVPGCIDKGRGKPGKNYCYKRGSLGPDGKYPSLVAFKKKNDLLPLTACEGDCSRASHCDEGLICHRPTNVNEAVPGCSGKPEPDTLYCITPPPPQRCQACVVLLDAGMSEEFVNKIGAKAVELMACRKMKCVKNLKVELDTMRQEAVGLTRKQKKVLKNFIASELGQKRAELADAA